MRHGDPRHAAPIRKAGVDIIGQTARGTGHLQENQFLIAMFEALVPSGASQPRGKTMAKKRKAKKAKARKKK
jgi:hypothetical protein